MWYPITSVWWGSNTQFGQPTFFGTKGTVAGLEFNGKPIDYPGKDGGGAHFFGPHVVGKHAEMGEAHVFEDMMQLVDWVNEGKPSVATAEHAPSKAKGESE